MKTVQLRGAVKDKQHLLLVSIKYEILEILPSYSSFVFFQLQRDTNLGKLSQDAYSQQAVEILMALKKLGETVIVYFSFVCHCKQLVISHSFFPVTKV